MERPSNAMPCGCHFIEAGAHSASGPSGRVRMPKVLYLEAGPQTEPAQALNEAFAGFRIFERNGITMEQMVVAGAPGSDPFSPR